MKVQAQPPQIDGLPAWAQILISIIFGLAALGAAYSGYFKKKSETPVKPGETTAAILGASIADMGAVRHLSDVCITLSGCIDTLRRSIDEQTHHQRNAIELDREVCQRLRELREVSERLTEIAERHLK